MKQRPSYGLRVLSLLAVVLLATSLGAGTEIESGYFKASATGPVTENIGFRPDYIEFITAQQIENTDFQENDPTNNDCPDNVNGWSEGSVIFDSTGVEKQFSIGAFRNSDSTNGHRVSSSTSDVIKNLYTSQDGNLCGTLEVSVVQPTSNGFEVNVESRYQYDELVRYKAYQFPDNMEFDAGLSKIDSSGTHDVSLDFQPANLHVRAAQQISSKNTAQSYWRSPLGRSKGYATLDQSGNVIDQQSIGTASSSDSTNAHRSIASDEYVLNTVYVDQNANVQGRLRSKVTGADSNGFSMQVDDYYTDDIFLYRAWGFSFYEFQIGYDVVDNQGTKYFDTDFEPDAIDIYAEQQIGSINNEVTTPTNNGCDNAGGWSNGYYETDDNRQWAISTGRTSDSQNSHRYGSTTVKALNNVYTRQNGGDCGDFEGEVTDVNLTGFSMDFNFDSSFDSNYDKEMVYFRAFDFKITPPQVKGIHFNNLSTEHAFEVVANISEGSNDINECDITANSSQSNLNTYSGSVKKLNQTWSQCTYDNISYDDIPEWEDRHDNNDELIALNVTINASDIDGRWSEKTDTAKFHNNPPTVKYPSFSNYSFSHRFNVSAKINADAETPEELSGCKVKVDDYDGNVYTKQAEIDHSFGPPQIASCNYSNVNSSAFPGFEFGETVNVTVNVSDQRGLYGINYSEHSIPNNPPTAFAEEPEDEGIAFGEPLLLNITGTDPDGDSLNVWFFDEEDNSVIDTESGVSGQEFTGVLEDILVGQDVSWYVKVGDTAQNYTTPVFSFTKVVSQSFRVGMDLQNRYSVMIISPDTNRDVFLDITNSVPDARTVTTMLKGNVSARFSDGSTSRTYRLPGKSRKEFTITVSPEETGYRQLKVVSRNENLSTNSSLSMPVDVRDFTTSSGRELPGIQSLQMLLLLMAAAFTYFLRL